MMTDAVSKPLTPSASTTSTMRLQSSATAARVGWTSGLPRTLGPLGLVRTDFSRSSVALAIAGLVHFTTHLPIVLLPKGIIAPLLGKMFYDDSRMIQKEYLFHKKK